MWLRLRLPLKKSVSYWLWLRLTSLEKMHQSIFSPEMDGAWGDAGGGRDEEGTRDGQAGFYCANGVGVLRSPENIQKL